MVLRGPRRGADLTPPPRRRVFFLHFWSKSQKKRCVFGDFRKRRFGHPVLFLFLWFSFSLLRALRRGRILEAYAIPPTPLEVAHDFQGIRSQNSVFKAFQREVRHLNTLSEASSGLLSRLRRLWEWSGGHPSTMSYNQDHGFGSSASSRTFMIAKFALRFGDRNRTSGSIGVRFCLSVDDTCQFETVGNAYFPNPQGG